MKERKKERERTNEQTQACLQQHSAAIRKKEEAMWGYSEPAKDQALIQVHCWEGLPMSSRLEKRTSELEGY